MLPFIIFCWVIVAMVVGIFLLPLLKFLGVIQWNWKWILAPLWLPPLVAFCISAFWALVVFVPIIGLALILKLLGIQ